eukprot:TRINITY_DN7145_c0_g1_i1.p1 TRINITY_DN7145_c0_g1~~TRINITY_DN7145_c0_g1_i1.p1  ORF type:complete len:231 (-),score=96.30 TRINITY_DN7145_c0_g1_i1:27-719(-)
MENSWAEGVKDAKKLQTEIETRLSSYYKVNASLNATKSEEFNQTTLQSLELSANSIELELDQLIIKLDETTKFLSSQLNSMGSRATSNMHRTFESYRERLADYKHEFLRTKKAIQESRSYSHLILSVQVENDPRKTNSLNENLLRERSSLANSDKTLESLVSQAMEARESLASQKQTLQNTLSKLTTMSGISANVNQLSNTLSKLKAKEKIILASVISFCLFFLIWWAIA